MLYSPRHRVLFAHYPKTAGSSIRKWFASVFPDCIDLDPGDQHLDVRVGVSRLKSSIFFDPSPARATAVSSEVCSTHLQLLSQHLDHLKIIGVIREPFDHQASH